jgi:hypothetical protein
MQELIQVEQLMKELKLNDALLKILALINNQLIFFTNIILQIRINIIHSVQISKERRWYYLKELLTKTIYKVFFQLDSNIVRKTANQMKK